MRPDAATTIVNALAGQSMIEQALTAATRPWTPSLKRSPPPAGPPPEPHPREGHAMIDQRPGLIDCGCWRLRPRKSRIA
jgi:hypothetical protein